MRRHRLSLHPHPRMNGGSGRGRDAALHRDAASLLASARRSWRAIRVAPLDHAWYTSHCIAWGDAAREAQDGEAAREFAAPTVRPPRLAGRRAIRPRVAGQRVALREERAMERAYRDPSAHGVMSRCASCGEATDAETRRWVERDGVGGIVVCASCAEVRAPATGGHDFWLTRNPHGSGWRRSSRSTRAGRQS